MQGNVAVEITIISQMRISNELNRKRNKKS